MARPNSWLSGSDLKIAPECNRYTKLNIQLDARQCLARMFLSIGLPADSIGTYADGEKSPVAKPKPGKGEIGSTPRADYPLPIHPPR
jgi:hypothetical protein